MGSFIKKILSLLIQPALPQISKDSRVIKILENIQYVSFIASILISFLSVFILGSYTLKLSIISSFIFLFLIFLTKKGFVELSAFLNSSYLIVLVSFGMLTGGEGIRDEILLILPAFFLLGSLFLNELLFYILAILSLSSIIIIGKLQLDGFLVLPKLNHLHINDVIISVILLAGVALIMRLITGSLLKILLGAIKSEQNYRNIFNASNEAVFIHDAKTGKILDVNDSMLKMYGYQKEEILSLSVDKYDFASGKGEFNNNHALLYIRKSIEEGPQLFEWQAKKKDGTIFWVEVSLNFHDGRIIAVVRDINEKKRIELELTQRDKMRAVGQLAGGIAHDFNNQLSGIMGFAEVVKMEAENENMKEYANHILTSAEASSHQIKQLLSFARKNENHFSVYNINNIVKQAVSILEKSIDRKIKMVLHLNTLPLWVNCDIAQLENAFLNIAINARDAMPDGGTLTIETKMVEIKDNYTKTHGYKLDKGVYARVEMKDTGEGISFDIREKIFEPFFTTKSSGKGTGMGLSAVYGTIKSHKGGINLESNLGEGTSFEIFLPIADFEAGKKTEIIETIDDKKTEFRGEGLAYVIDDEPSVRALAKKHLGDLGYNVSSFEDGEEAIKEFKNEYKDVKFVLLDMIMPHISGEDIFYALKEIDPNVNVIIVSGFSLNQNVETLLSDGAIAYVQKPYKRSELIEILKSLE